MKKPIRAIQFSRQKFMDPTAQADSIEIQEGVKFHVSAYGEESVKDGGKVKRLEGQISIQEFNNRNVSTYEERREMVL